MRCDLGRLIVACILFALVGPTPAEPLILRIDARNAVGHVSPLHAGLMTEEINHSYDGGLYGELINNRVFTEPALMPYWLPPPHWSLVTGGNAAGVAALDRSNPLNSTLTQSLRLTAISASPGNRVGLSNEGFWGIPVRPATRYRASLWVRVEPHSVESLTLSIEDPSDPTAVYASANVRLIPGAWRQYDLDLTIPAGISPTARAAFVISSVQPGTVWLNVVSLFPPTWNDRPRGNRIDLVQKLAQLHPAFVRFPGGNYLEGNTVATRFDWKKTLGDPADRPTHPSWWGYPSSDGMGLLEFLELCEDLHAEPVLAVYAGYSIKEPPVHAGADLQPFVQDALDEIQYVAGDAKTPWGARRAREGHPAPFKLTYVEIGNEDNFDDKTGSYESRFAQFFDAIKAAHPTLKLIATASVTSRVPDVVDEHYYREAQAFFGDVHHYDLASRSGPKIFVGEWATFAGPLVPNTPVEGEPTPNLWAALGDAAWLTGLERNADLVIMQAYAPLLANVNPGAFQWAANLIGYDALTSYGSPSYYVQVMFNAHRGDEVLSASPGVAPLLFTSVTRDSASGAIYVKAVNAAAAPRTVSIEVAERTREKYAGKAIVLSGHPQDTNTIQQPTKVIPVEQLFSTDSTFSHTFPADSVTVLELRPVPVRSQTWSK